MANERDEFSSRTKDLLAGRVGTKCSNPDCRNNTCGPNSNINKVTNIGVAAHICAAAKGGPRYDASMTQNERKSYENGIWLCQSCAKLIDDDPSRYTKEVLQEWKNKAEEMARREVGTNSIPQFVEQDMDLIKFYIQCFDRPAFHTTIYREVCMEDFDKALEDTLIALDTGVLKARDGSVIKQKDGKSAIQNSSLHKQFDNIVEIIITIRKRLRKAKQDNEYYSYGSGENVFYNFYDPNLGEWFNSKIEKILELLSVICKDAGLPEQNFQQWRS